MILSFCYRFSENGSRSRHKHARD